jgi:hypothetical protein
MSNRLGREDASLPLSAAGRVDECCDRFEEAWIAGRTPRIEDFLESAAEAERPALLGELVRLELEYRRQRGESPALEEYRQRFPEHADRIEALFGPSGPGLPGAPAAAPPDASPIPEAERGTWSEEPATRVFGQSPPPAVELPEQLGRYRILRVLGEGGMGTVYLAHDTELDREVALKVPRFSPEDGPTAVERFIRSARAAATLAHPNLCPVYDAGQLQGIPYLTMPHLEGQSLAALLREGPPWPPDRAVALVHKLALALQAAHQKGIVHRDLNPTNILLTPAGEPTVMDFGLARKEGSSRITQAGQVLGTPGYLAPEQLSGSPEAQGPGCDIFSLGVILYELLTGELPFGRTLNEVLLQIMTRDPEPPSSCRAGVPLALDAVCAKALARRVEDRYQNMGELTRALQPHLGAGSPSGGGAGADLAPSASAASLAGSEPKPRAANPTTGGRRWMVVGGAAIAILLVGLGASLLAGRRGGPPRTEGDQGSIPDSRQRDPRPPQQERPETPAPGAATTRFEAEALKVFGIERCGVWPQDMSPWGGKPWSQEKQVFGRGVVGGWVEWQLPVEKEGGYYLDLLATQAPDYAKLRASIDGKLLEPILDMYGPRVLPLKPIRLGTFSFTAGQHRLRLTVVGKNNASTDTCFGVDAVDLSPAR